MNSRNSPKVLAREEKATTETKGANVWEPLPKWLLSRGKWVQTSLRQKHSPETNTSNLILCTKDHGEFTKKHQSRSNSQKYPLG